MASQTHVLDGLAFRPTDTNAALRLHKARQQRILSIGRESNLLEIRSGILNAAGCCVRSATPEEVSNLIIANSYHVSIFCHSLTDTETAQLATSVRTMNPGTKLLLITALDSRPGFIEALFDDVVSTASGPGAFRLAVENLLHESSETAPFVSTQVRLSLG